MTLRVAITGVGGDVARGAILGLRRNPAVDEPIWLLGLGAADCAQSLPLLDRFVRLPLVEERGYVDALAATLHTEKIDILLAGIDSEIKVLSAARHQLAASGAKVLLAPAELVEAAADKLLTSEFLSARGVHAPDTCDAQRPADIGFPIVAKPRLGHGSKGLVYLSDRRALRAFLDQRPQNYCLQRHIEGPEITVGFLYDAQGAMRDAIAMERTLEFGRTVRAKIVDDIEMLRFMEDFGRKIPGLGAVNAQLRWDEQRGPMIFEINARLSGSTDMRVAVGFNDPLRLVRHFGRGEPIVPARPRTATIHRVGAQLLVEPC